MLLSIIIPVYNEQKTLATLLEQVEDVSYTKEIIVIDDGSTDSTAEILLSYESRDGFKVVRHDQNRGKGAAIRTGLQHATGDIVIIDELAKS
jgi:glycosyltransferase involved in cell wall biosynthesis